MVVTSFVFTNERSQTATPTLASSSLHTMDRPLELSAQATPPYTRSFFEQLSSPAFELLTLSLPSSSRTSSHTFYAPPANRACALTLSENA